MAEVIGLTTSEVQERAARGESNQVAQSTSRAYKDIILENVFSAVNIVLYVIGIGLALVGDWKSAIATVGLVLFNGAVGIIQEIRAKRQLDQIALLARAAVHVYRDGQEQEIDPAEIVLGDVLVIRPGDQIPTDGVILGDSEIHVDESALTGESDLVVKAEGDTVLSGTFCVAGEAYVQATKVGEGSFANKLTQDARKYTQQVTPLQRDVNRLLRVILVIVIFFALLAVLALFVLDLPFTAWLQIIAVITGSVSAGLLTLITLNYSWSALRIGQKGGLVQQINAVESLSNVTVLCTDKTGTLTTNEITYHDVYPVGIEKPELQRLLGAFVANASSTNKTSEAVAHALPGTSHTVIDEVPFMSDRKWSALAFFDQDKTDAGALQGIYVFGALEMLQPYLSVDDEVRRQVEAWSANGLRVLVFARNLTTTTLHDETQEPVLPPLTLLGVVSLSDTLRPHLQETLAAFTEHGVKLKVISGDNPETVQALARQAGLGGDLLTVSGPDLAQMNERDFAHAATQATIFGRITPHQKENLVDALRGRGEYVAMIGDGVNDVLSLKKADVGIAMESGSTATRSVASMLLLGDSFEVLPEAFTEGQRTVNSIQEILKFFMTTVFALLFLIIGIGLLGVGFPFTVLQSSLVSFFARGVPPFVLAVTATAGIARTSMMRNIMEFTLPASLLIFLFGLLAYIFVFFAADNQIITANLGQEDIIAIGQHAGQDFSTLSEEEFRYTASVASAQTALTTFFVLAGVLLMVFAHPPFRWLAYDRAHFTPMWIPTLVAGVLIVAYTAILALPRMRALFDLVLLPASVNLVLVIVAILWGVIQLAVWRANIFPRFLDMKWVSRPAQATST